tara:strand:+ start:539 stop:805 length:267 start_codon:yes stop_codon:yes gene_type:complete
LRSGSLPDRVKKAVDGLFQHTTNFIAHFMLSLHDKLALIALLSGAFPSIINTDVFFNVGSVCGAFVVSHGKAFDDPKEKLWLKRASTK